MTHYVNLIKRHKRTAVSVALIGSTLMFSACGEEPKPPIEFTLGKVEKVDTDRVGNVAEMLFNKDRSVAYVRSAAGMLSRVNVKDGIKAFSNNDNWTTLTLRNDGAPDSVGFAKLNQPEPAPTTRKMFLAQNGLLVLAQLKESPVIDTNVGALAYFTGDLTVPTNAWVNNATHSDLAAFAVGQWWNEAHSVKKDNKELIVVASQLNALVAHAVLPTPVNVSSVEIGPNKFTVQYAKAAPVFAEAPKMASDKDYNVYFVSSGGVSVLENSKLGVTNPIPVETADAVAAKWEITPGTNNNVVRQILSHDGKIFISLTHGAANTGGIAVYNIADKKNTAPVTIWNMATATNLHLGADNNVQAVLNNSLINIKADDGAPGDVVFSNNDILINKFTKKSLLFGEELAGKTQYQYTDAPYGFDSAYKFGDNLLLKTAGNQLYSVIYETKSVPASKLKNQPQAE